MPVPGALRQERGNHLTLSSIYNSQISLIQHVDFCLRILFAFICGGIIGRERSRKFKEAGIRTHILVCCTTALLMLVSKYGFMDLAHGHEVEFFGTRGADAARIAAQAVSGISFLCAGVIFKVGTSIKGLTTAAGIWLTAGIGLAIGAGMYVPVVFTLLLLWFMNIYMRHFRPGTELYEGNQLQFVIRNGLDFDTDLHAQLIVWKAQVTDSKMTRNKDGTFNYDLVVRRANEITYAELSEFVEGQGDNIISVSSTSLFNHLH